MLCAWLDESWGTAGWSGESMADVKREIRTLGQRLSGLTAGNKYTFVLKRPNVRVDVVNAEKAIALAETQIGAVRKLLVELEQVRNDAMAGSVDSAKGSMASARATARDIVRAVSDAKEFAIRAAEDAKDAHADVKDAYSAAKDGAEHSVGIAENLLGGLGDVVKAVSALIIEAEMQAPPPPASAGSSSAPSQ